MARKAPRISRRIGRFRTERRLILLAMVAILVFAGYTWIEAHPEHNPAAPLDLRHPVGMATAPKLASLKADMGECRAVLDRSQVAYEALDPVGEGDCARDDRVRLEGYPLAPDTPPVTCPVAAALAAWRTKSVEPAAQEIFGTGLAQIEHLGAYSCRRTYGSEDGPWSEHATANAIDIAAFVFQDGRRVSLLAGWDGEAEEARFLRQVREGACEWFATVLSPDYNAAHADHFHLDQDDRWMGVCR